MPLFLLVKSDNSVDNQLKVSCQEKINEAHWEEPASQTNRKVVFVSAKVLLFTQIRRIWSWVSPRHVACIRGGHSVEDLPATCRGRPVPEPQRQLDGTQTCHQHPTKAAPDQNQDAQAKLDHTQGRLAAALAERLLLSSTHSFLTHLPTTEGRGRGWTLSPLAFPHTSTAKREMCWAKRAGGGGKGPWSRPLVYQRDLCPIHLTCPKCPMNFGHYTKSAISWVSAENLFLLS